MITNLFNTFFYNPIYNILVFLIHIIPTGDVGVAVVIITLAVRFILLPLSLSAARTQHMMSSLTPHLNKIKEKHKDNKEQQAKETMALYKEMNVNPFSSFIVMFLQIPILLALYMVFLYGALPHIDSKILYSFVSAPTTISMNFLGIFHMASKSMILAAFAGITQYFQATLTLTRTKTTQQTGKMKDISKIMNSQIRFVFPIIIAVVAYSTSGAIALYFVATNLFGIFQEKYLQRLLANIKTGVPTVSDTKKIS
ncbi:MAG TPA: YidC/Oxa1 family membrane protein insertase [Candidatus Kaiserbacteria bacterium]|nr:YidC/Oxa1 family membrane protein insertase [Candidatus Kaiserbacteria bacterium]